jgi:hypothetical protein
MLRAFNGDGGTAYWDDSGQMVAQQDIKGSDKTCI